MTPRVSVAAVALLGALACAGGAGPSTAPAPSAPSMAGPEQAVKDFLDAAADSNVARMAELWGTAAGPAAATKVPPDYERRVVVMQAYLKPHRFRIFASTAPDATVPRRVVDVEFRRDQCVKVVPVTVVRTVAGRWLVNAVDIAMLGNPAKPCAEVTADST